MVQLVECLPHKYEDLCLGPQNSQKKLAIVLIKWAVVADRSLDLHKSASFAYIGKFLSNDIKKT